MKNDVRHSPRIPITLVLLLLISTGCARDRLCRIHAPGPAPGVLEATPPVFRIGCPDVLEVQFHDRPQWNCVASVAVDGTLNLGPAGRPQVEGLTLDEAREAVARVAGCDPLSVVLRLAESRAARIYLNGPINNTQRPIPYQGPERVLDFLWRVGAVQPGQSDLTEVVVIRPNVARGKVSEVYHVNVPEVVFAGDHTTNLLLQPSDQVYVGETRRSIFSRLVPEWLLPFYQRLVGIFTLAPPWPDTLLTSLSPRPSPTP